MLQLQFLDPIPTIERNYTPHNSTPEACSVCIRAPRHQSIASFTNYYVKVTQSPSTERRKVPINDRKQAFSGWVVILIQPQTLHLWEEKPQKLWFMAISQQTSTVFCGISSATMPSMTICGPLFPNQYALGLWPTRLQHTTFDVAGRKPANMEIFHGIQWTYGIHEEQKPGIRHDLTTNVGI